MFRVLYFITLNNFRSFFGRRDSVYYLVGTLLASFFILKNLCPYVEDYPSWFLLFSVEILKIHKKRRDNDLLKSGNHTLKLLLFAEYLFYSLPIIALYILTRQWYYVLLIILLLLIIIALPKFRSFNVRYPFSLFFPFWTISFRKYTLWVIYPLTVFLAIQSYQVENKGLVFFALLISCLKVVSIVFQRESKHHISMSMYLNEAYLLKQIHSTLINSLVVYAPLMLVILFFEVKDFLFFIPLLFIPISAVLIKYSFFDSELMKAIVFAALIGTIHYGVSVLILPYFYYLGVKKIKAIQTKCC